MTKRKHESHEPSPASDLLASLARGLDELRVPYLVIGGQAVIQHGYRRHTEDIDIELSLGPWDARRLTDLTDQLDLLPKFPQAFEQVSRALLLPLVDRRRRLAVDFAFSPSEYLLTAIDRAPRHDISGYPVAFAAIEDLIIRKVIANRPRDRNDIDQLLLRHAERMDLGYVETWLRQFEEVYEAPLVATFRELLDASRK